MEEEHTTHPGTKQTVPEGQATWEQLGLGGLSPEFGL